MSEPTNKDRAGWATMALAAFTEETFNGGHPDTMVRDDLECAIADLIADLLHLAGQQGFEPQAILESANSHYQTQIMLEE
jgi:hypothetical protein